MPQLNQPYSYLGEYVQLTLLAAVFLALVCFYMVPNTFAARVCAVVVSTAKSPLEQFAVPFAFQTGACSFLGGLAQASSLNMVGVYSVLSLGALICWVLGAQVGTPQVQRSWGGVFVGVLHDTSRSIVGSAYNVVG